MNIERLKNLIENPKYTKKKIKLVDGRILSYSECGNITSGMPALFCFGLMTSSVAIMFAHQVSLRNNLRVIAVDYPGIGESTIQEDRTLGGWADDMTQFCDQVLGKYSKVRLLGHSLGGLHALALLSDKSFKARVTRTVLLSPWLYIEGDKFNPSWMNIARGLPDVFQSSIIPMMLTNLSSGSIQLAGWSNPQHTQLQAAKIISSYCKLQGHAGNEQMVRLALSKSETYLPQDLESPVVIYHGTKDSLVLGESVSEVVRLLVERNCSTTLISIPDGDHNSVLADPENLSKVMESLVGTSEWLSEIFNSLRETSRSMPDPSRKLKMQSRLEQKSRSMPGKPH
jgi:pimeloyl-ACP methyl ester carboxylesterase